MKHDISLIGDGELAVCHVCCGAEGSLTKTDCPGVQMTDRQQDDVYRNGHDFISGCWTMPL